MKFEVGPIKYESKKKVKKPRKPKKQKEFSKTILKISWLSGSAIILFACFLTYMMVMHGKEGDVQLVAIILTGGFAEITAGTSFYFWKSRSENLLKLSKVYGEDTVAHLINREGYEKEEEII